MMITFINHDTNAVYPTAMDAFKACKLGNRIDFYVSKDNGKTWEYKTSCEF